MRSFNFRKQLLATSIVSILGSGVHAYAEDAANTAQDAEVIEITGIRSSLKQNINTKRYADTIVDAITSEDIGKFPDKNVAESLSRITGVGISREFGEGEKITIRGSGPTKNRTLLNGQNVATADWFILDQPSRGFNFTLLPSQLVKSLEVYKAPEADIDEGSIGGTVIMNTHKPLDLDANTIKIGIEALYSESSEETDPLLDAFYSWKNEDETFGALISVVKQDRTVQREGLEVLGWTPADEAGIKAPKDIGAPIFRQDRERETIFASFQYAPSDELDFSLNILTSELESDNQNINLLVRPQNDLSELEDVVLSGTNVQAASVMDGSYEWDFINRESRTETNSYDLEMNYQADNYFLHAQVGYTDAEGGTYNETSWSFVPNITAGYDFDLTGKPTVNIDADPTDGSVWSQNWTWGGNKPTEDEELYAQVDLEIPVEFGAFSEIKVGLKYRDHDRSQERQAYSWHGPETTDNPDYPNYMAEAFGNCPTLDTCDQSSGVHKVASDVVGGNIVNQLDGNKSAFWHLGFGDQADYAISDNLGEIWAINETITAAYVKGSFSGDNFRGNVGVRVVDTEQTSESYNFSSDSWGFHTVDREWLTPSYMEWVSEERTYTEVLPSLNVAFDLTDDQILRFAAGRVMARANFSDLAPTVSVGALNVEYPTATAGNPSLDPEIANQFDVAWEWYFNDASLLSLTYFYKDVKSYRTSGVTVQEFYNEQDDEWVDVAVTQPKNGLGGSTDGIEIGYQQGFGNFGIASNYTYTNAENDQERDESIAGSGLVEGASEHMYNATVYYETETYGASLMYNYRSEWYKGLHFSGDEVWNDSFGQIDFSANYQVTENIRVIFEAMNLNDEQIVEYNTSKDRVMSIYENGRRYVAGVHLTF
ncbi:TonB-dependent receptor [Neiella marina]|uniref:TonB-dependent receptor n=1 Tax=Neiella holothuriorum TaxID=2870530 RepID=A0ABS7EAP7_9GAMM|nr:TonB-dependent receptor [Neiella holothuriorum]MBW8189429.1 TonB-dependent receptor [Neiella holothuriorum]